MSDKKKQNTKNNKINTIFIVLAAVLISFGIYSVILNNQKQQVAEAATGGKQLVESIGGAAEEPESKGEAVSGDADLKILKSEISEKVSFYPYNADGTYMEVLALKASDGSIRTALNTCQICFNSGQGYYKQEGDKLVCQNCGNKFGVEDVEIVRGGCNPVPIMQEYKTDDGEYITINKEFLEENKELFVGWKR